MPHVELTSDPASQRHVTLVERDEPLAALSQALDLTRERGRLVSVCGEAGIGKSSLLEVFTESARTRADFFRGGCDALHTPSPLAPIVDVATAMRGHTIEGLRTSLPRHELFAAFLDDLSCRPRP